MMIRLSSIKEFLKAITVLLTFVMLLLCLLLPLVLDNNPLVIETKTLTGKDVVHIHGLSIEARDLFFRSSNKNSIKISESDLNSFMGFIVRAVPRLKLQAIISDNIINFNGTYSIPKNPFWKFLNISLAFNLEKQNIYNPSISIGHISLNCTKLYAFFIKTSHIALGTKQKYLFYEALKSITVNQKQIIVTFNNNKHLSKKRLLFLKNRLKKLRNHINPLGDPKVIRLYYSKLLETSHFYRNEKTVSLSRFIQPVFTLASERSKQNDPIIENRAAIMALSTFAGLDIFESITGEIQTEKMKNIPVYNNIVLSGRKDLCKHFIVSAGLKLAADSGISLAIGEIKELHDSAKKGGSGFSFVDLAFDRAGVRFAENTLSSRENALKMQSIFSAYPNESLFCPVIEDFPEDLKQSDFELIYGGINGTYYISTVTKIDKRIERVYSYLIAKNTP